MARKVEKHLDLIRLLVDTTESQRLAIVQTLSPTQIKILIEAIYNVLRGTCPISDSIKKSLFQKKEIIRRLVTKDLTDQQQRRLLVRHRAVLPLLLKPVVTFFAQSK